MSKIGSSGQGKWLLECVIAVTFYRDCNKRVWNVTAMAHSNSPLSWPLKPVLLIFDGFNIYGLRAFFCTYQICH